MNIKNVESALQSVNLPMESLVFGDNCMVGNLSGFKTLMSKIKDLPLFKAPSESLLGSSIYNTSDDSVKVPDSEYNTIYLMHSHIVHGISAIMDVCKETQQPEDADSVTIKIPDPADFNEAVESQSDFLIAISQNVQNLIIGGKVVLTSWEPGPFRLTLNLGSSLAVGLVGGMASAATVGLKKHQEGKMFEHMVKGLDVKTEAIQEVLRGLQVYVNQLLDTEAKKLHARNFNGSSDPEQEARLLHAIKLFMALIEKGAELYPSRKASESVKSSFPDFTNRSFIKPATEPAEITKSSETSGQQTFAAPAPVGASTEVERLQAA
jgi:hypothetical protein